MRYPARAVTHGEAAFLTWAGLTDYAHRQHFYQAQGRVRLSGLGSQHGASQDPTGRIAVFNPACSSTIAERASLTPRTFQTLSDKTVFLVDIGWGGPQAGLDVLQVMQGWFARNVPTATTVVVAKKGGFAQDDPELWQRIKAEGDACIIGVSC